MRSAFDKTNILIVMHGAGLGGVEKSLKTLCKYLDRERFTPIVAVPAEGPFKSYVDGLGIATIITPIETWTPVPFDFGERHYFQFLSRLKERVSTLANIVDEHNIDIVHSSTLSVADGALAARLTGKPHVWHIHGKSVGTTDAYGSYLPIDTLYSLVKDLSSQIVAVSEDVRRFLNRYLPESDMPVIYNGLDIEEFDTLAASASSVRGEYNLQNKKLVVVVGRVAQVKGVDDFIESAISVIRTRSDAAFLVVGPDQEKDVAESVKKRVETLNLSGQIIFTGRRNDIPALLRESDIFVCSSKTEGFPYSILEAMAAGKPVVTTRCGGPEEIVIHEETGLHVDVGRSEQIAQAVVALLDDAPLAGRMGRRAREVVKDRFSAEVFARNFEKIYADAVGNTGKEEGPWPEVFLNLASTIGDLGGRIRRLEHEARDLRSFEAMIKDNVAYRGLKKLATVFGR